MIQSLNPKRQPNETQDDYKERRKVLNNMAKCAGKRAKVLFNSGGGKIAGKKK